MFLEDLVDFGVNRKTTAKKKMA